MQGEEKSTRLLNELRFLKLHSIILHNYIRVPLSGQAQKNKKTPQQRASNLPSATSNQCNQSMPTC